MSGRWRAMAAIASAAAGVRKVISATGRPPSARASASGKAWPASSISITGTMPWPARSSKISIAGSPSASRTSASRTSASRTALALTRRDVDLASALPGDDAVALGAEPLHLGRHHLAGPEPWLVVAAQRDARRRASGDDVAGLEAHHLAEIVDEV